MNGFQIEKRLIYKSDPGILYLADCILSKPAAPSDGCALCSFSGLSRRRRGIDDSKLCTWYLYDDVLRLRNEFDEDERLCINSVNSKIPPLGIQMAWISKSSLIMSSYTKINIIRNKIIIL